MKESKYRTYEDLPLMLNADAVKDVLGISISSAYELMYEAELDAAKAEAAKKLGAAVCAAVCRCVRLSCTAPPCTPVGREDAVYDEGSSRSGGQA